MEDLEKPQMLVWFSINHPIIGVPNFDPYPYPQVDTIVTNWAP